ncbi:MAG: ECF-type biotin uptake system substrate-binding component BioY [Saliniramus fredricksonii]|uniref:Biotin transporter n=1 Tax=Saliniramus fredricksonii TaxID=1653334 RepID=A0A0P8A1K1_9HYPH|nr:biotin transporter BioY [Saliniramus fredricksonii]KPQ09024.1 MAG: ECF-type biotin uptake system substrate-binding component BioY [Saliniramus fredricksonii]SCC79627.1 biotin transport system substrate-specific component [Saliniramus fredricksonii]
MTNSPEPQPPENGSRPEEVLRTLELVHIALFAAIIAVLGLVPAIPIPFLPVPITAQTLGVMLAGTVLGSWRGMLAVLVFIALVAMGMPLLPGGRGGLPVFLEPTAGFLLTWPIGAFVIGWLMQRFGREGAFVPAFLASLVGGIVVIYAGGIAWLDLVAGIPLQIAATGVLAFVPGDLIKAAAAASVASSVHRVYPSLARTGS